MLKRIEFFRMLKDRMPKDRMLDDRMLEERMLEHTYEEGCLKKGRFRIRSSLKSRYLRLDTDSLHAWVMFSSIK